MFKLYKSWLMQTLREPTAVFWSLFFPILLATLLTSTLSNLNATSIFEEKIKIQIIENEDIDVNSYLSQMLDTDEFKEYFEISYVNDEEKAIDELKNSNIDGYMTLEVDENKVILNITTGNDEFNTSMIKSVFGYFVDTANMYSRIIHVNGTVIPQTEQAEYLKPSLMLYKEDIPTGPEVYIYPLIGYAILMGTLNMSSFIFKIKSDLSETGARINISSTKKWKLIISGVLSRFTIQFVFIIIFTLYLTKVLNLNLGLDNIGLLLLLYVVGILMSLSLGTMLTIWGPKNAKSNEGLVSATSLLLYALAGGMVATIPELIQKTVPILHYINPAVKISDCVYELTYLGNLDTFYENILVLIITTLVLLTISVIGLRRKKA